MPPLLFPVYFHYDIMNYVIRNKDWWVSWDKSVAQCIYQYDHSFVHSSIHLLCHWVWETFDQMLRFKLNPQYMVICIESRLN